MPSFNTFPFSSLPEEIQGCIFEIAVDGNRGDALNLSLVSRTAAAWVLPCIFRQVILSPNPDSRWPGTMLPRDLEQKPKDFLAAHVKRLCMAHTSISLTGAVGLLASCAGLVDLAIWIEFTTRCYDSDEELPSGQKDEDEKRAIEFFQNTLNSLPGLQSLSFVYDNLMQLERSVATSGPPAWCARLRYLDLVYWSGTARTLPISLLKEMESLTHLSFAPAAFNSRAKDEFDVLSALEVRPTLRVVLILLDDVPEVITAAPLDIRIIYRPHRGGEPMKQWKNQYDSKWIPAEAEIARRRAAVFPV
ncbi:hypothetical protein BKA70DRAFT_1554005 [Coprinopsis sp. MPI-PUGE-AT-0042]|nr:hypothetical protein BKA70DRAFT_1554005 [Coprinopsis sp. MPI-PUGE-AT-0042]